MYTGGGNIVSSSPLRPAGRSGLGYRFVNATEGQSASPKERASPVAKIQAAYHSFTAVLAIATLALTLTMCVADESVMTTDALADGQAADFLTLDPALD
jgi:hypothetical protein